MPSADLVIEIVDDSQYVVTEETTTEFLEEGLQGPPGSVDTQLILGSRVVSSVNYIVDVHDYILYANTLDNGITFLLPESPVNGQIFEFKKVHANHTMAISGNTRYIDGSLSISFTDVYSHVKITFSGPLNRWYRLS